VGVRRLLDLLKDAPVKPRLCIVGEPTLMQAVTAHKGKLGFRVTAHGLEAHSSLAPIGVNAIYMAADLIGAIRAIQADIADHGIRDGDYEVAYTTLHVGKMQGGEVMNIVPNRASFDFEIRYLPEETSTPSSPASRRRRRRSQRAIAAFSTRRVSISRSCRATPP
jgi:acetylornithine deacetylase